MEPIAGDSRRRLAIAVSGDLVLIAGRSEGLKILSVEDPAAPTLIGTWNAGAQVVDAQFLDDIAVIELETGGTQILDLSDPETPTLVSQIPVDGKMQVDGNKIYVAAAGTENGLQIFDLTEPASPQELGRFPIRSSHEVNSVAVSGDHVFVSAGTGGIYVIDASTPSDPSLVIQKSVFSVSPPAKLDLSVSGRFLFVFIDDYFDYQAVDTIDISNPAEPKSASRLRELCCAVEMDGNTAFYAGAAGVGINAIDLEFPTDPFSVGGFSISRENLTLYAGAIAVAGDRVYVAIEARTGSGAPGGLTVAPIHRLGGPAI